MTFSIVARDPETGDLGIAVQSKFPAVGSLVPWIKVNAGAIATQALANLNYGTTGIRLLKSGMTAEQTLRVLLEQDLDFEHRQVGIVDFKGTVATHTGKKCYSWAGHLTGDQVTCQGNILIEGTVDAMIDTYLKTNGDLPAKLLAALKAGQNAGGDSRGQQSASLLVYRENGGYGGGSDVWIDVRVDDHPEPIVELSRVFDLYSLTLLEREDPTAITELTGDILEKIANVLVEKKYLASADSSENDVKAALLRWIHTENFENKIRTDGFIWNSVLHFLVK
ncbi:MAG: DUF1028 domain-containing protein [Candidatus Kariarchaeaceae archaeon]|jgi:uncharacterized Ntn-hydrolase superfamily protein